MPQGQFSIEDVVAPTPKAKPQGQFSAGEALGQFTAADVEQPMAVPFAPELIRPQASHVTGMRPIRPVISRPPPQAELLEETMRVPVTGPLIGPAPPPQAPVARARPPLMGATQGGEPIYGGTPPIGTIPLIDLPIQGVPQVVRGVTAMASELAQPPVLPPEAHVMRAGRDKEMANAASDMIEGLFKIATPLVVGGAITAPIPTALELTKAIVAQQVSERAAAAVGASPEAQRLAGNLGAFLSGTVSATAAARKMQADAEAVIRQARAFDAANPPEAEVEPGVKYAGRGRSGGILEAPPEAPGGLPPAPPGTPEPPPPPAPVPAPTPGQPPAPAAPAARPVIDIEAAIRDLATMPPSSPGSQTALAALQGAGLDLPTIQQRVAAYTAAQQPQGQFTPADVAPTPEERAAANLQHQAEAAGQIPAPQDLAARESGKALERRVQAGVSPTGVERRAGLQPNLALQVEGEPNVRAVADFEEAGRLADEIRDRLEQAGAGGASQFPKLTVVDTTSGEPVATISYNGRMWRPDGTEIPRTDNRGYGKPGTIDVTPQGTFTPEQVVGAAAPAATQAEESFADVARRGGALKRAGFLDTYIPILQKLHAKGIYGWPIDEAERVAARMATALARGSAMLNSPALRAAAKELGIKNTVPAWKEYFAPDAQTAPGYGQISSPTTPTAPPSVTPSLPQTPTTEHAPATGELTIKDSQAIRRKWSNEKEPPETDADIAAAVPEGQDSKFYDPLITHYGIMADRAEARMKRARAEKRHGDVSRWKDVRQAWLTVRDLAGQRFEAARTAEAEKKPEVQEAAHGKVELVEGVRPARPATPLDKAVAAVVTHFRTAPIAELREALEALEENPDEVPPHFPFAVFADLSDLSEHEKETETFENFEDEPQVVHDVLTRSVNALDRLLREREGQQDLLDETRLGQFTPEDVAAPTPEVAALELETKDPAEIFPAPKKTVRAKELAGDELLSETDADTRIAAWKAEAERIGREEDHSNEVVFSLFDHSGKWSEPYEKAGYQVVRLDIKDGDDLVEFFPMSLVRDVREAGYRVVGVLAAPPCTSFAVSGARWWESQHDKADEEMVEKKYGYRAARYFDTPLDYANTLVAATQAFIELANPEQFHVLENPVGRIAEQNQLPKPTLTFDPANFGNPYTKKTLLWGDFNPNLPTANVAPRLGSFISVLRGDNAADKEERSLTPEGFAYAFFMANHKAPEPITQAQHDAMAASIKEHEGVESKARRVSGKRSRPAGERETPAGGPRGGSVPEVAGEQPETPEGVPESRPSPGARKRGATRRGGRLRGGTGVPESGPEPRGSAGTDTPAHVDTADLADSDEVAEAHARGEAPRFFVIDHTGALTEGGAVAKLQDNMAALRLLKTLEKENRPASDAEQQVLARYIGWGHTELAKVVDKRGAEAIQDPRLREARQELDRLLTADEMKFLSDSTINAHYSFADLPRAMWALAQRLGFQGGTILEPAVGTGHFLGTMPGSVLKHKRTKVHAVEMEPVAAGIARQLYQGAFVQTSPLQEAVVPDNYFDLVISNVPFGKVEVFDPAFVSSERAPMARSVHNYYFAKALDVARPGGLVIFVTSRYTMDSRSDVVRKYLAERARFIGAFRLPDTSFRKTAGTDVVTDVIVLQKDGPGLSRALPPKWLETVEREDLGSRYDNRVGRNTLVRTNEYFVAHPDHVLGTEARTGKMQGTNTGYNVEGELTPEILQAIVDKFPEGVYRASTAKPRKIATKAPVDGKQGSFVVDGGKLYTYDKGTLAPSDLKGVDLARAKAFIPLRDAYQHVLDVMNARGDDASLKKAQQALKNTYDAFVRGHGHVNLPQNRRVIELDPNGTRITTLENIDAIRGGKGQRATFVVTGLADIFTKRTHQPIEEPTKADSATDALVYSLAWKGEINLAYMQALTGKSEAELVKALGGEIFQDPIAKVWVPKDEYLSGDVVTKLAQADAAAKADDRFQANVDALQKVQPPLKGPEDFEAPYGATWVPAAAYQRFLNSVGGHVTVRLVNGEHRTTFYVDGSGTNEFQPPGADFAKWAEQGLNGELPTIRTKDSKGNESVDAAATEQYRQSLAQLRESWATWWRSDKDAIDELPKIYNGLFNRDVPRTFNGEHLVTPNSNPAIVLRPWQKNAVQRALQAGNTLLAHAVGAGKTYAMIAIAGEQKRLGLATKPMIVVPNHLLGQWQRDFLNFYPTARVLVPEEADFSKARRQRLITRIANNDWDAVIMAQSQFLRLGVRIATLKQFVQEQETQLLTDLAEQLNTTVEDADALVKDYAAEDKKAKQRVGGRGVPRSVKDIVRAIVRLRARLQKRLDQQKKDVPINFEDLGVDSLLVDEAHLFKNLYFSTAKNGIVGLRGSDADRALDMYLKVRMINQASNQRNVIFATGTPVSNTMSEIYTMFRYLAQPTLERLGLAGFDAWANSFAVASGSMEPSPGGGYKERVRLRDWNNLRELSALFRHYADVVSTEDLIQSGVITLPKLKDGKPAVIALEPHPDMPAFMEELAGRIEALKSGKVDPREDNHLKITTQAALAAVDLRLVKPAAADDPNGRIRTAAREIAKRYKATTPILGTQVVFLDVGTPKKLEPLPQSVLSSAAPAPKGEELEEGAEAEDTATDLVDEEAEAEEALGQIRALGLDRDLYSELKRLLVAQGVKPDEVAFIHQATNPDDQKRLFAAVRAGRVRVLLATTAKGGVGMNIQDRLVALHHLDVPWRPADMEQREGRILRQGNQNAEVEILRYVTKKSFDEYRWGLLATKQSFIAQFMKGTLATMEDIDPSQLDMQVASALASGDPRTLQMLNKEREIVGLRARAANFTRRQNQSRRDLQYGEEYVAHAKKQKAMLDKAAAEARTWATNPIITINVVPGRYYGYDVISKPKTFDLSVPDDREALKNTLGPLMNVMHVDKQPIGVAGPFTIYRNTVESKRWIAGTKETGAREIVEHRAFLTVGIGPSYTVGYTPDWDTETPPDLVRSLRSYLTPVRLSDAAADWQRGMEKREIENEQNREVLKKTFDQKDALDAKERELYELRVALGLERKAGETKTAEQYADELRQIAQRYHDGRLEHEQFSVENRKVWEAVAQAKLTDQVKALLSKEPPEGGEQAAIIEEERPRRGPVAQATVVPGVSAFTTRDVEPAIRAAFKEAAGASKGIRAIFAPGSVSSDGETMAAITRPNLAMRRQRDAMARKAMAKLRAAFDRLSAGERQRFAVAVDEGRTEVLPEWQQEVAKLFEQINRQKRLEANALGGKVGFVEHYYPREWLQPGRVRAFVMRALYGKRPLQGRAGFRKARSRDKETGAPYTYRQMLGFGFEPVTDNPVEAHLRKWTEMDKWIAARRILLEGRAAGLAKFVKVGEKPPEGWERYPESFGTVYGPPVVEIKEAFDAGLMEALFNFAQEHDITVVRKVHVGGQRWGYHVRERDRSKIVTKFGGPEGVLMHEIGHALDAQYGLGELIGLAERDERQEEINFNEVPSKVAKELRALADLRTHAKSSKHFRKYVRQRDEVIANLVHAFLYVPETAKEVAPTAYWALYNLVRDRDDLRGLLDIQKARSLRFGVNTALESVGGRVIKGYYYGPPDAVALLENHLSPGLRGNKAFDLYRRAGNFLNQVQLGLSIFHVMTTAFNSTVSRGALALEQLSRGDLKGAAKNAAITSTLVMPPILDVIRGHKYLKRFYEKDATFRELVHEADIIAKGGGGVGWDTFWHNSAVDKFMTTLRNIPGEAKVGNYPGAALRTVGAVLRVFPALVELQAKPVMEWWVPRLKLAAYMDLARMELKDLGEKPHPQEAAKVLGQAWDSVDNRFGQLIYDNLFWHNVLKDGLMATVRAVGWDVGTVREVFGAIPAQLQQLGALPGAGSGGGFGKPPTRTRHVGNDPLDPDTPIFATGRAPLLTHQFAYFLALLFVTAVVGAIYHYLHTGKRPEKPVDYYFPQTGAFKADGRPERASMWSYMKDFVAFLRHPITTTEGKLHPALSLLYQVLSNEDHFGTEIRNPEDPLVAQLEQMAAFLASQYRPISVQSFQERRKERGETTGISGAESFFGVNVAPQTVTRSAVEDYLRGLQPPTHRTQAQAARAEVRREVRNDLQAKNLTEAREKAAAAGLSRASMAGVARAARQTALQRSFGSVSLEQGLHAYEIATPEERAQLKALLAQKAYNGLRQVPADRAAVLKARFQAALKLPVAKAAAPAAAASGGR